MTKSLHPGLFLLALLALAPALKAAERVTLQTGFVVSCDHHTAVGSRSRLFMNAVGDNYLELPTADISDIQVVPDTPVAAQQPEAPAVTNTATGGQLSHADLTQMLSSAGHEHNIDVDLLASLVKAESNGNPRALSHAGAQGLMQLMPRTATELGVNDSFKPDQNVRGGSTYLDSLLARYNDNLALALAAYNAGPAAVDHYHGIPPYHETRAYVAHVIHEFNQRVRTREAAAKVPATALPALHN